jgi:hypothetical protein
MAKQKRRMKTYARRQRVAGKRSRKPAVILCVVIFLVLCVAISVVIGVLLGKKADEVRERPKFEFEKIQYESGAKSVMSIEGYHFAKGASASDYYAQGIEHFSLCLRHDDGTLDYSSEIAEALGFDVTDRYDDLSATVRKIKSEGGRACGYFYVRAFDEQNDGLRDVYLAYEIALIEEMAKSGIDEILLLGIGVDEGNIAAVEEFLARAAISAPNTAIGVSVSLDTLGATEREVYLAARMKNACDFLALDLCHLTLKDAEGADGEPSSLESIIAQNEYYIKSYGLRLLFSKDHSQIYRAAKGLGVVDFQIVGR